MGVAYSVFVSGSDVYVAGWDGEHAVYWKNGIVTSLTDGFDGMAAANSIFVSGSDVYVAGDVYPEDKMVNATYWKNGIATDLSEGVGGWSGAKSIFVTGSNVHVAGWSILDDTQYWKNGNRTSLNDDDDETGGGSSIFVSGSDVYIAGHEGNVAKYWKNNIPVNLTDGESLARANSIFVRGIAPFDSYTTSDSEE